MQPIATERPRDASSDAADLIHSLADFVKVCTLYPPNNERVQQSVRAILDKIRKLRGDRPRLEVRVLRDRFAVDQAVAACDMPNTIWFAECMTETALGGIAVDAAATSESLLTFAALLRDNVRAARTSKTFEDLWSRRIPGLTLSERLFAEASDEWGDLSPEARRMLEDDSPRGIVLREFLADTDGSLQQIEKCLDADGVGGDETTVDIIELLRNVVDLLPDSVLADTDKSLEFVRALLMSNGASIAETGKLTSDFAQLEFRRMILDVSTRYFSRKDATGSSRDSVESPEKSPKPKSTGHAGDEKISDDIDEFVTEYASLPDGELDPFESEIDKIESEQLGIALHQLLHCGSTPRPKLEGVITERVVTASPDDADLLRCYLEQLCTSRPGPQPWAHLEALSGSLERTGLLQYMTRFGIIPPDVVAATFPHTFTSFLRSLDEGHAASRRLVEVCKSVGPHRLMAGGADLDLTDQQRQRIYTTRSRHVLPFAQMAMEANSGPIGREEFELLTGVDLKSPESAALRILDDARLLPPRYVTDLCRVEAGLGGDRDTLRAQSARMLRNYIELPPDGAPIERRVRAIRALRQFWSASTEAFVRSLLGRSGILRIHTNPKPIRDVAKELLQGMAKCKE